MATSETVSHAKDTELSVLFTMLPSSDWYQSMAEAIDPNRFTYLDTTADNMSAT